MKEAASEPYVSRGGEKLAAALDRFGLDVTGLVCADLGSHVGGFVDCLLRRGAARVHSVDTAYGTLAWKLRRDSRVVVYERTNAMHVSLPEPVDLVTIDVGWTPQSRILPNVARLVTPAGQVVTLLKPHYEAGKALGSALPSDEVGADRGSAGRTIDGTAMPFARSLVDGVLPDDVFDAVVKSVLRAVAALGWTVVNTCPSPIRGHAGNRELFALLTPG